MTLPPAVDREDGMSCVWALAGVLSYRLCDRQYDCDRCDLHRALRGPAGAAPGDDGMREELDDSADALVNAYVRLVSQGCALRLDRSYSSNHLWLEACDSGELLLGLDEQILQVMHPIDDVTLPRVGVWLRHGEPCGWITRGRVSVSFAAPVSGEVTEVNSNPACSPDRRAWSDWLFRVRPHEEAASVPDVYTGERALRWHLRKMLVIERHLREGIAASTPPQVGPTAADGGLPERDLAAVLGGKRFEKLVIDLFHMQI